MLIVIPFPGTTRALEETFTAEDLRAGIELAGCFGFKRAQIDALFAYDRQFAIWTLGLLGSADTFKRRSGEIGLRRLIKSMERDVR